MRVPSSRSSSAYLILLVLTTLTAFGDVSGLRCYICNSEDDPACAKSPPESLAEDCAVGRPSTPNPRPGLPDAKVCWSQYQDVKGTKVVVRQCGGSGSTANGTNTAAECYDRVGSKGIRVSYCKCSTDLCNSAVNLRLMTGGTGVPLLVLLASSISWFSSV